MSENNELVAPQGSKGLNRWWVNLEQWQRQALSAGIAICGSLAFDSIFRTTMEFIEVGQLSQARLRQVADPAVFVILYCGSFVFTKIVRKQIVLEDKCKVMEYLLEKKTAELMDAKLAWGEERELLYEKIDALEELHMEDSLTGLLNRRGTLKIINQNAARIKRSKGEIHILFIDLDKLKAINTRFGHATGGDKAIVAVAQAIQGVSRVEEPGCRFGGDEFLMIIPYENILPENLQKTEGVRKRLLEAVRKIHLLAVPIEGPSHEWEKIPVSVTVAIHILDPKKPLDEEINKASEKMLTLKKK